MFAGLNSACVSIFGEPSVYTFKADGSTLNLDCIVELLSPEEQQLGGIYIRLFFVQTDLGTQPQRGDTVTVRGQDWLVYESLIDDIGGCVIRAKAI